YAIPGTAATAVTAMVPYFGPMLTVGSMQMSAYDDVRHRLMDRNVGREEAARIAGHISGPLALVQYIPERLGLKLITRRIPAAEKIFDHIGDRITNRYLRTVVTGGLIGMGETGTEYTQGLMVPVAQEIAAAFSEALPGPDWDDELKGFWSQNITT